MLILRVFKLCGSCGQWSLNTRVTVTCWIVLMAPEILEYFPVEYHSLSIINVNMWLTNITSDFILCSLIFLLYKIDQSSSIPKQHKRKHTYPSTQPLTWQHNIKSQGAQGTDWWHYSTLSTSRGHWNNLLLPKGTSNVEISNIKFHCHGRDSNSNLCSEKLTC